MMNDKENAGKNCTIGANERTTKKDEMLGAVAPKLLDQKIQNRIYELEKLAEEKFQKNDLSAMMECIDKAWKLYPEPKINWTEAYNMAKHGFLLAKDVVKDFNLAKKWLNCMIEYNNKSHLFDGDLEFNIGTYKFDTGALNEAYKMFKETIRQSGKSHFRYFEGEDKNIWNFKRQKALESKNNSRCYLCTVINFNNNNDKR
jgi:tetratricopeptide (TPR) repeat protein